MPSRRVASSSSSLSLIGPPKPLWHPRPSPHALLQPVGIGALQTCVRVVVALTRWRRTTVRHHHARWRSRRFLTPLLDAAPLLREPASHPPRLIRIELVDGE